MAIEFVRTPNGVKCIHHSFSFHLDTSEIKRLSEFSRGNAQTSSTRMQRQVDRATLRAVPLDELEAELKRRERGERNQ